jgi:hypothetical protein
MRNLGTRRIKVRGLSDCVEGNWYRLCGLVVRFPGYISGGPGSIPGATRFSEK